MAQRKEENRGQVSGGLIRGARVYLSGPMDFAASRETEQKSGWRTRIGQVLREFGVVFGPWNKPEVPGLHGYGKETAGSTGACDRWTFEDSPDGAPKRATLTGHYWETLHIDLRMVDTADFIIAYCPTNVYSVGTVHEIALSRLERKPVLFVSPPTEFPTYDKLVKHLANDPKGMDLLKELKSDGFGFQLGTAIDERERRRRPVRPLLPFLEKLNKRLPLKWDNRRKTYVRQ